MCPYTPGRRTLRGFTLIEILVVVAIIALLVSILLPSLQRAREQAKTLVCKTRLMQLYRGHVFYGADNRGRFPHWDWWLWDGTLTDGQKQRYYPQQWIYRATGGVRSTDSRRWVEYGDVYRYIKEKEAYFCPSDNKQRKAPSIGGGGALGQYPIHSFNRLIDPHQFIQNKMSGTDDNPRVNAGTAAPLPANFINPDDLRPGVFKYGKLPQVARFHSIPSRVAMMWEPDQGIGDNPAAAYTLNDGHSSIVFYGTQDQITSRHGQGRGHILYWDGRADLVDSKRWNSYPADQYVLWKGLGGGTPPASPP